MTAPDHTKTSPPDRGPLIGLYRMVRRRLRPSPLRFQTSAAVLDHYVSGMPTAQTAVDCMPGWIGAMPPEAGCVAGTSPLFADTRIVGLLAAYACDGKAVLELGPLEGAHTYMLHKAGAASIDAIEANTSAFVRCLITKEVLALDRANLHLGDFMRWLEETDRRFDLVVASGVLYHGADPVRLLELIAGKADSIFLWTHYFDEAAMPRGDVRRKPFNEEIRTEACRGVNVRMHERTYDKAWKDPSFCGGLQDRHFWIDRGDIIALLGALGFDRIDVLEEQPDHRNGPSFSLFAQRTVGSLEDTSQGDASIPEVPRARLEPDEVQRSRKSDDV